jgi:hypothetical protein
MCLLWMDIICVLYVITSFCFSQWWGPKGQSMRGCHLDSTIDFYFILRVSRWNPTAFYYTWKMNKCLFTDQCMTIKLYFVGISERFYSHQITNMFAHFDTHAYTRSIRLEWVLYVSSMQFTDLYVTSYCRYVCHQLGHNLF